MNHDKMMGRKHEPQCDCNIEQYVSGAREKCNHRYGVKRQRTIEKREVDREIEYYLHMEWGRHR